MPLLLSPQAFVLLMAFLRDHQDTGCNRSRLQPDLLQIFGSVFPMAKCFEVVCVWGLPLCTVIMRLESGRDDIECVQCMCRICLHRVCSLRLMTDRWTVRKPTTYKKYVMCVSLPLGRVAKNT